MTRIARAAGLSLVVGALVTTVATPPVMAQTSLLEVEKADATKLMQVYDDGGLVVKGGPGGTVPATGAGARLMWYPAKAAFRAGAVQGTEWDGASIGFGSVALGLSPRASGGSAIALGEAANASGYRSIAMGLGATASGIQSMALGNEAKASAEFAFATGEETVASGSRATAMGSATVASGVVSTAFGANSTASGANATAMGAGTTAAGNESTAMGSFTVAQGAYATAMGRNTKALGPYSTAMGTNAAAFGAGGFAYGDQSTTAVVTALIDQFVVRASGGFRFRTKSDLSTGCDLDTGSGSWSCTSSRLAKERFEGVSGEEVLHRLRRLSIQRWSYLGLPVRHIGPVAEEFYAAFALGEGPTTISTVDADGVSLLAVQALERRTEELRQVYTALRATVDSLTRMASARAATSDARIIAPEPSWRGKDGDTLALFLHHVKPGKRAAYERWFSEVWAPALRAVAEKRPSARRQLLAERDLRPIHAGDNGADIYAYLYDPWVDDAGGSRGGFPNALLIDAGRSPAEAQRQAEIFKSLVERDEGYTFVQRQF